MVNDSDKVNGTYMEVIHQELGATKCNTNVSSTLSSNTDWIRVLCTQSQWKYV